MGARSEQQSKDAGPVEHKLQLVPLDAARHVDVARRLAGNDPEGQGRQAATSWRLWLALLLVGLPTLLAVIYNGLIAADRYVSTASYIVRQTQADSSLVGLLQAQTVSRVDDESHAIAAFIRSRDAVSALDGDGFLLRAFDAAHADIFSRFPGPWAGDTREDLFRHFQDFIHVEFQTSTGVSVLTVEAFSPEDARRTVDRLLVAAERLVNRLNDRARSDAIALGQKMVDDALAGLAVVRDRITSFRIDENLIDPGVEVKAASELIKEQLLEASKVDAKIAETLASAPNSPVIGQLRIKRQALENNVRAIREQVAGSGDTSLARKIADYERLILERELAEKRLAGAVTTMEAAAQEARAGRLYLQRIVEPSLPDQPAYPWRLLNVLMTLGIAGLLYWIVVSMVNLLAEQP